MKKKDVEKLAAISILRNMLKPGDEIDIILRHVSRSGMSRKISLFFKGENITYYAAQTLGENCTLEYRGNRVINMGGCGMDMGFACVYNLSSALFPDGFGLVGYRTDRRKSKKVETVRPATQAEAAKMVKRGVEFRGRNGDTTGWDSSGGYALKHRWL